jgi:hypothetical protein
MFITIPKIYGKLFPEYDRYCGRPLRFVMSMYGTTLCGKYWYLDLLEHLLELGFKACESVHFLFMRVDIGVPLNAVNGPVLVHYLLT